MQLTIRPIQDGPGACRTRKQLLRRVYQDLTAPLVLPIDLAIDFVSHSIPEHEVAAMRGINCVPNHFREEFADVSRFFEKTDGISAWLITISFEPDASVETAHSIGMALTQKVWGRRYQCIAAACRYKGKVYEQILVNAVSFLDGRKLNDNEKNWYYLRHQLSDVARDMHQSRRVAPCTVAGARDPLYGLTGEARKEKKYELLRQAIDHALETCRTVEELETFLRDEGYYARIEERLLYWTIVPKGMRRSIRTERLGENYTKLAIQKRLWENRAKWMS